MTTELLWFVLFDWLLNLPLSFKTSRKQLSKEFERKARLKSGDISKRCICESKLSLSPLSFFWGQHNSYKKNPEIYMWEKEVANSFRARPGKLGSTDFCWLRWKWVILPVQNPIWHSACLKLRHCSVICLSTVLNDTHVEYLNHLYILRSNVLWILEESYLSKCMPVPGIDKHILIACNCKSWLMFFNSSSMALLFQHIHYA